MSNVGLYYLFFSWWYKIIHISIFHKLKRNTNYKQNNDNRVHYFRYVVIMVIVVCHMIGPKFNTFRGN